MADSSSGCIGSDVYDWWNTVMIYSRGTPGNGVWHCPFTPEWVAKMKHAAKRCEFMTAERIEMAINKDWYEIKLPPGKFLSEPQDARGLPLSWCEDYDRRHQDWPTCCVAIYNYRTVPDLVVTNGVEDWPLVHRGGVLTA